MTLFNKRILSLLFLGSLSCYYASTVYYEIDNPFEIHEYLLHLNNRRKLRNELYWLKNKGGIRSSNLIAPVSSTPNQKEKLIERIKDHTVKISRSCIKDRRWISYRSGTGWFLDYEIPENGKYPLKWFLATNSHVINEHTFKSNPYNQVLPIKLGHRPKCHYDGITLSRWESGAWDEKMFQDLSINSQEPTNWTNPDIKKIFENNKEPFPYTKDLNFSEVKWSRHRDTPLMEIKIRDPKLFFAPFDFLDNIKYPHFKDFAVLQIDFPNERSARRLTEKIYESKEKINFLSPVSSSSKEFFIAGYPSNSYNTYKTFGNYSRSKDIASILSDCKSHISLEEDDPSWSEIKYSRSGCYYGLRENNLGEGSSGSMVVDIEGNLLGLHTLGDKDNIQSFTEPIRMNKSCLIYNYFCTIREEYDLISGGFSNQKSSYKSQVLKYKLNTNLKRLGGW